MAPGPRPKIHKGTFQLPPPPGEGPTAKDPGNTPEREGAEGAQPQISSGGIFGVPLQTAEKPYQIHKNSLPPPAAAMHFGWAAATASSPNLGLSGSRDRSPFPQHPLQAESTWDDMHRGRARSREGGDRSFPHTTGGGGGRARFRVHPDERAPESPSKVLRENAQRRLLKNRSLGALPPSLPEKTRKHKQQHPPSSSDCRRAALSSSKGGQMPPATSHLSPHAHLFPPPEERTVVFACQAAGDVRGRQHRTTMDAERGRGRSGGRRRIMAARSRTQSRGRDASPDGDRHMRLRVSAEDAERDRGTRRQRRRDGGRHSGENEAESSEEEGKVRRQRERSRKRSDEDSKEKERDKDRKAILGLLQELAFSRFRKGPRRRLSSTTSASVSTTVQQQQQNNHSPPGGGKKDLSTTVHTQTQTQQSSTPPSSRSGLGPLASLLQRSLSPSLSISRNKRGAREKQKEKEKEGACGGSQRSEGVSSGPSASSCADRDRGRVECEDRRNNHTSSASPNVLRGGVREGSASSSAGTRERTESLPREVRESMAAEKLAAVLMTGVGGKGKQGGGLVSAETLQSTSVPLSHSQRNSTSPTGLLSHTPTRTTELEVQIQKTTDAETRFTGPPDFPSHCAAPVRVQRVSAALSPSPVVVEHSSTTAGQRKEIERESARVSERSQKNSAERSCKKGLSEIGEMGEELGEKESQGETETDRRPERGVSASMLFFSPKQKDKARRQQGEGMRGGGRREAQMFPPDLLSNAYRIEQPSWTEIEVGSDQSSSPLLIPPATHLGRQEEMLVFPLPEGRGILGRSRREEQQIVQQREKEEEEAQQHPPQKRAEETAGGEPKGVILERPPQWKEKQKQRQKKREELLLMQQQQQQQWKNNNTYPQEKFLQQGTGGIGFSPPLVPLNMNMASASWPGFGLARSPDDAPEEERPAGRRDRGGFERVATLIGPTGEVEGQRRVDGDGDGLLPGEVTALRGDMESAPSRSLPAFRAFAAVPQ
uniref:Uncharacterized protein n=1 Tax=Chromera velia CCMP2878 TaxID=1169474 RepID=A0A0G4H077_9ALVE|eukprot:Cvel_5502.t1-p1 / transcript=Cvel_5502.t1 / gene=Cvel_5502 / organism=Chromera_velia_CCMP2878 / gene_product=hypothetical protein / transcript_product=hypothetical protein / location=Cvel_scaffold257:74787-78210(+) / protein_length=996 / sequence_SO=supercontig / SO=protein_coding / is_pseudo=false